MKAKTMTDMEVEHRAALAELTQQIRELNHRMHERDATIVRLIAETDLLRAELWRLVGVVSSADAKSILRVLAAQGQADMEEGRYVSLEQQKLNDAMERGDELRDRAKDEKQ